MELKAGAIRKYQCCFYPRSMVWDATCSVKLSGIQISHGLQFELFNETLRRELRVFREFSRANKKEQKKKRKSTSHHYKNHYKKKR